MKNICVILSANFFILLSSAVFASAPATLTRSVTYNDQTITMRLTKENLRGPNFELWAQNSSGGYDVITPVAERSYLGTVDGHPGAVSCGVLLDNGDFKGTIYFDRGATWFTLNDKVTGTRGLDHGVDRFTNFQYPSASSVTAGQAGTSTYRFDVGVDAVNGYYTATGSNVASCFENIEYSVNNVRAIYMRDVLLRPALARVIIRTDAAKDPYKDDYSLPAVRTEWNTNQADANRDVVCSVQVPYGGGLAWVKAIGTGNAFTLNGGGGGVFDVIWRHELGHNFSCSHFVGGKPEGKGLMGGNSPGRISGCEAYKILSYRDNRISVGGILDNEGVYTAVNLPPYAAMDASEYTQTVTSSVAVDVLANDYDANGDAVTLESYDKISARGGKVTRQGQDLVYTAKGDFIGTDYFLYKIADPGGRTATGVVIIDVRPKDPLRAYLPLDETAGTTAFDSSVFGKNAVLKGEANFDSQSATGQFAGALTLDGIDYIVEIPALNLNSNTVTMSVWIKRNGTQVDWAGVFVSRSGSTSAGINIRSNGELRYMWNNLSSTWGWPSGLVVPADKWVFVALVIEPEKATMYMYDGTLRSKTNNVANDIEEFNGVTRLGYDNTNRYFKGDVDEARIYDRALSQAQIQELIIGGITEAPSPFDGAAEVRFGLLNWVASPAATSSKIYIGTDRQAVTNATTASGEYRGENQTSGFIYDIQPDTTYYWRIDSVTESGTKKGDVWTFKTDLIVGSRNKYIEQNSSGRGRLVTTGADVKLAPAGTSGSLVQWKLIPAGSDNYYIQNASDGRLLRAVSTTSVDLAEAGTLDATTQWKLQQYSDDWMFIVSAANGKKLHRRYGTLVDLAEPIYTGSNMQWAMIDIPIVAGDANFDELVDYLDLAVISRQWLENIPLRQDSDLSGDAFVDLNDFAIFARHW